MSTLATMALLMASIGGTPDGIVLNFTATWCGPCQQMSPIVSRLQQQGYAIRKVDFDREKALVNRFNITAVPTFVLVVNGQERERYSGPLSEDQLRRMAASIPEKAEAVASSQSSPGTKPNTSSNSVAATIGNGIKALNPLASRPASGTTAAAPVIRANVTASDQQVYAIDPMQVVTRIRVTDSKGMDFGSGTIISSEPGQAHVLTCGHIFRHFDQQGRIEVDVFSGEKYQRFEGALIRFDLKKDIGLISIKSDGLLPIARVATAPVQNGDHVFSAGCGGGDPPTKLQHIVTKTTGYQEDIVECTSTPVQGRSGGGLFTTDCQVVGVCILADPNGRRGLYMGLKTIHGLLDQCGLTHLYRRGSDSTAKATLAANSKAPKLPDFNPISVGSTRPDFSGDAEEVPSDAPADDKLESLPAFEPEATQRRPQRTSALREENIFADASDQLGPAPAPKRSSLADNSRRGSDSVVAGPSIDSLAETLDAAKGAEVVCIIRDPKLPNGASRVVIIHRASEKFVSDLTGELDHQVQRTSLGVRPAAKSVPVKTPVEPVAMQRYRRNRQPAAD